MKTVKREGSSSKKMCAEFIELCGAVKRGYSGCDRRLPCAAPTATMYPDTPTFYIDSNIDPGLSQPSSSYRSFYLYEICWGHEKSSEDPAFLSATPSWQDESTSEGSEGKPLLRPKGLRGPPLAAPARNVVFSEMFYAIIVWNTLSGDTGGATMDGQIIFQDILRERKVFSYLNLRLQVQQSAKPRFNFCIKLN